MYVLPLWYIFILLILGDNRVHKQDPLPHLQVSQENIKKSCESELIIINKYALLKNNALSELRFQDMVRLREQSFIPKMTFVMFLQEPNAKLFNSASVTRSCAEWHDIFFNYEI